MTEHRNKKLLTLSKGNQQKIQLITALVHNPDIIILDEPFSGLDPVNAMLLKDVVKEQIALGKIVLFSSHQMSYIEEFCDSIAILNGGRVVITGDLAKIKYDYPRDRLTVRSRSAEDIAREFDACERLDGDSIRIKLKNPDEKAAVMKSLCERFDIDEIKIYEPTLNDIFVEYAKDGV
jgi:ABC-2 type transport system ATP-binding protein